MKTTQRHHDEAQPGDVVEIHGHTTGDGARTGVILDVLGLPDHVHYRVKWDEEHESLFWPGSDALVRPGTRPRRSRPGAKA
jgi:hypothetical protein